MKKYLLLIPLVGLAVSLPARSEEQPGKLQSQVKLPAKEKMQIYLLIGQSNMAGRGTVEAQDQEPHARVFMFTSKNEWAPAIDPLHFDKPAIAGVGLGSSFGRAMADANPDVTIGLVPCAVGGTPLSRWQKKGDLYLKAVARIHAASQDGTLAGVLWHQGENDAGDQQLAQTYGARLAAMIRDLREELRAPQLPFVAGKLGEFLLDARQGKPNFWRTVNEQLTKLPELAPNVAIVESAGLKPKADGVHFDTPSLREFGRRYAKAMQGLQAKSIRSPVQ